jgi:glycosyltransferase involved in cell wall biosynthesis
MTANQHPTDPTVTLSLVVPVYNNAERLEAAVRNIHRACADVKFEIVLVNNGSSDGTEMLCTKLAEEFSNLTVIHLSRQFGGDNAVLAGLKHTTGENVAIMDAYGQPGIENVFRMLEEMRKYHCDVVYGAPEPGETTWLQRLRSRINDQLAKIMLQKPAAVSLWSFKVLNRFVVNELLKYRGSFPFIDGLIYRSTSNIRQIVLNNIGTDTPQPQLSMSQRIALWSNMFLNISIIPLRLSAYVGLAAAAFSVFALVLIWIDKIYFSKDLTPGIRTTLAVISLFAGIQLMILGVVGEYLGRLFLDQTGTPQSITRYVRRARTGQNGSQD